MESDFCEQFRYLTSLTDVIYYYHVTNVDPEKILSEGLYMVGSNIYETANEIPEEFRENPLEYALNERGIIGYRENASIIIIGVLLDKEDELVKESDKVFNDFGVLGDLKYYISKENILGYIDTVNKELIINELADIDYCYHL